MRFHASRPDSLGPGAAASDFHTFVLRAVDNRGGISPLVIRAFYAYTVAPDVHITRPIPNPFLVPQVPIPFRVEWKGEDADGEGDKRPVGYRYRLLDLNDPYSLAFILDPDSLLRLGAATAWQDWTTLSGEATSHDLTISEISPGARAMAVVLAVDAAGATTPYVSFNLNALMFDATLVGSAAAPRIHVYSPVVDFTYQSGGYSTDPLREIPVEVAAQQPIDFHWDAAASPGRLAVASRWMVVGDILDETPRSDPSDITHWSAVAPVADSATLPGFVSGDHRLYIEMRDDFGDKSLGIVRIQAVPIGLTNELLVVDDTRLEVDRFNSPGTPNSYTQAWPSAAELDTFLYARGGVLWRGSRNPAGALSTPGLLAGFSFDTLGTRLGLEDPAGAVTLTLMQLARYRRVLWIVDGRSALNNRVLSPVTALYSMSGPGRPSALAAYVEAGGLVWLAGGGAAFASLRQFDRSMNNGSCGTVFSVELGELGPGRTMYEHAHVRSALGIGTTSAEPERSPAAVGEWSGHGPSGTLSAPDYSRLPARMRSRTPATDPIPPTRLASQGGLYYATTASNEVVIEPNEVTEAFDPVSAPGHFESALDTLFEVSSPSLCVSSAPAMLYYHGRDNSPFVFTGFDLWSWTRSDCQALVDFVLGDIWGMTRGAARTANVRAAAGVLASPRAPARIQPARPTARPTARKSRRQ